MTNLLLATANVHKLEEIRHLLADVQGLQIISLQDFPYLVMPDETGSTMAENAAIKASYCARQARLPALADDSGIEVDALGGEPGVHSARWTGGSDHTRMLALLDRLKGVSPEHRTARYRCAICLCRPSGKMTTVEATCEGRIATAPSGSNGFGYDPIFELTAESGTRTEWIGRTMAEAPPELKARISHRARAMVQMIAVLGVQAGTILNQ